MHNSKSPETLVKSFLELIKNTERKKYQRGATHRPRGWGERPTPLGAPPSSWAPWKPSGDHLLLYEVFYSGKNHKQAFGKKIRSDGTLAEPIKGSGRAVLPGKLPSGRGKSSPSSSPMILSSGGGQSPSTSSPAPSPLKP